MLKFVGNLQCLNATVNILDKGLQDLYNITSEEKPDYMHGEELSLLKELHPRVASLMKCRDLQSIFVG